MIVSRGILITGNRDTRDRGTERWWYREVVITRVGRGDVDVGGSAALHSVLVGVAPVLMLMFVVGITAPLDMMDRL